MRDIIAGLALAVGACGAEKNPDFCETNDDCAAGEQCSVETNTCIATRLALDNTGFFDDGTRWFTSQSGPLLRGTLDPVADPVIRAFVGTTLIGPEATIAGTTWSLQLPESTIPRDDVSLHLQLVGDGRTTEIVQTFALDDEAPVVVFADALVRDERDDAIDFSTGAPIHDHVGLGVPLAGTGCPDVFKHAYLMDEDAPAFGGEVAPNPVAWTFRVTERAGLDFTRSVYRVRDTGGETLLDFTPVPEAPRGADVAIPIHRRGTHGIAALGDGPRELEIDVIFVDWAGHEAMMITGCWNHNPLAAPLHLEVPRNATGHDLALDSVGLAGGGDSRVVSRLLNAGASTSLTDLPFANDTAEPVVLTIDVTKPARVDQTQTFALQNFLGSPTAVNLNCGPVANPDTNCDPPPAGVSFASSPRTVSDPLTFFVKLFEVDATGVPTTEVPCLAPCPLIGSQFRFAIPPRGAGEEARSYLAMTMVGQIPGLWPQDPAHPAAAPFESFTLGGASLTGKKGTTLSPGCTQTTVTAGNLICTQRRANTPYRALTSAQLALVGNLVTAYSVGVNATVTPSPAQQASRSTGYATTEGALP